MDEESQPQKVWKGSVQEDEWDGNSGIYTWTRFISKGPITMTANNSRVGRPPNTWSSNLAACCNSALAAMTCISQDHTIGPPRHAAQHHCVGLHALPKKIQVKLGGELKQIVVSETAEFSKHGV